MLELSADGKAFTAVPPVREPFHGIDWGAAVVDLAGAITEGRPHRASAEHAAHVVELLGAVTASIEEGRAIEVRSSFVPPKPLEWAG